MTCELLSERKQRFLLGSGLLVLLKGSVWCCVGFHFDIVLGDELGASFLPANFANQPMKQEMIFYNSPIEPFDPKPTQTQSPNECNFNRCCLQSILTACFNTEKHPFQIRPVIDFSYVSLEHFKFLDNVCLQFITFLNKDIENNR